MKTTCVRQRCCTTAVSFVVIGFPSDDQWRRVRCSKYLVCETHLMRMRYWPHRAIQDSLMGRLVAHCERRGWTPPQSKSALVVYTPSELDVAPG